MLLWYCDSMVHKNINIDRWNNIKSPEINTWNLFLTKEDIRRGKDSLFNKWCWENWTATCKRMKLEHFLRWYTKINSKCIKGLNVRPETIKLLEENIGRTLDATSQSKILYDPPTTVMEIKTKVNKWDLIELKSFCTAKETISKVKRQPSEWEKTIANETTDKGLISKIYKQLIQLNTSKINNPIKKWEKDPSRHFPKEDLQITNKHIQRCSTLLIIREMQIKTTKGYYLTLIRMAIIKMSTNNKSWKGCGEKGTLLHDWCSHYGKQNGGSLKNLK